MKEISGTPLYDSIKPMAPTSDNSTLNLPELPSLEETRMNFGGWNPLCCLPIIGSLIYLIVTRYYAFSLYLVACCILFFLYARLSGIKVIVDKTGIEIESFSRKRFIAWQDVVDAYTTPEDSRYTKDIVVKSNTTIISFTAPVETHYELIEASIRQHLSRYGKAGGFILSDDSLSIWAEIPEDIPDEIDYIDNAPEDAGGPRNYELRADYISQSSTAQAANMILIHWNDVSDVRFGEEDDYGSRCVLIESRDGSEMYIRDLRSREGKYFDKENAQFLLAVIRNARKADAKLAIVIPRGLRERYNLKLPGR
ncbi:MAG: hypothetical protein ABFD64_04720 [Armatimonadota bacterium]